MKTRKRVFTSIQLLLVPFVLTGCGAAAIATIAATSGGSSSGGARVNTTPSVEVDDTSIPTSVTGNLVLGFNVSDSEGDAVSVKTEISGDNGNIFRDVPDSAIVSGANVGLTGNAAGVRFSFTINLSDPALFPGQTVPQAVIRLSVKDGDGLESATDNSIAFRIANNSPPLLSLVNNNDDANSVALSFVVSDAEATTTLTAIPVTRVVLTDGIAGVKAISSFNSLTQSLPITPGTLLIRYDNGSVLRDVDNGNGTGNLVALSGPAPVGTSATISYTAGVFEGDSTILVQGMSTSAVTADYNRSFLTVTKVEFDDLRDTADFEACRPQNPVQTVPFPVFVDKIATNQTYIWNSLADLDFGNSQFIQLRIELTDGQNTVVVTGNNFLVNNGPLGANTQIAAIGQSDQLKLADLDGDGFLDAVIIHSTAPTASVATFFNNGQGYENPILQSFPTPIDINGPVLNTEPFGSRPMGGTDPNRLALIDINRDGFPDLVISNDSSSPERGTSPASAQFLIYFGTGIRSQPFDLTNFWGPLRTGGFGVSAFKVADVDLNGTDDLIIVNQFSHLPDSTSTRSAVLKRNTATPATLAQSTGGNYTLADANPANGQSLATAGIIPGTIQIAFIGPGGLEGALGDQAVLGNVLGVVADAVTQAPVCYVIYANGLFIRDPRLVGLPAPLGPLGGMTSFAVTNGVDPVANFNFATPIQGTDSINDANFVTTPLQAGDTITVKGWGHKGLSNLTEFPPGNPILNPADGLPAAIVNKTDPFLPINMTFTFGTDISTFEDLRSQIETLYQGQIVNPLTERLDVSIDASGFIRVVLSKLNAGPDTQDNPNVTLVVAAEIQISDSQMNSWPLFQDPHGRISIYNVRNVDNSGGFETPNLSQTFEFPAGNQFFPSSFPATKLPLLPNTPDATGRPTLPGLGVLSQTVYALVDGLGGAVVYPPSTSTAGGAVAAVGNPIDPPAHLKPDPNGLTTYTGGLVPLDADVGLVLPLDPTAAPNDPFNDIIVACAGDGVYVAFAKVPKAFILGADPTNTNLQLLFGLFDYLDGLFATQELNASALINTNLFRATGSTGFFIQPNGVDLRTVKLRDFSGDGLLDLVATAGNFIVAGKNLFNVTPLPDVPFDVRLAVAGLAPGIPDAGDVNNDNLVDLVMPIGASKEVSVLIQTLPLAETFAILNSAVAVLDDITLTTFDSKRAVIFPGSVRIDFTSGGVPFQLRGQDDFTLLLFQNPGLAEVQVGNVVGGVNPLTGALQGSSVMPVDGTLVATYDQLFQNAYTTNANLVNFKLIKFPTGFIPIQTIAADVNQDGLLDIVTLDGQSNNLSFRLQSPELSFDTFTSVPTGLNPLILDQGNIITGNNETEVVVTNSSSNTVSVYRSDAVLGLVLIKEIPLTIAAGLPVPLVPFVIKVEDLNQDGGPAEIVVAVSAIAGANAIAFPDQPEAFGGGWVLIPGLTQGQLDAGATLQPAQIGLGYGSSLATDAVDINGDGRLDIVLTNNGGGFTNGSLSFYLNKGPGPLGFSDFTNVPDPSAPTTLLPLSVPIEGSFFAPTQNFFSTQFSPVNIQVADLNNDGRPDMLAGVGTGRAIGFPSVALYKGKDPADNSDGISGGELFYVNPNTSTPGTIGFQPAYINISEITTSGSVDLFPVDFNGDGRKDIVVGDLTASASVGVMINRIDTLTPNTDTTFSDGDFLNIPFQAKGQPSGLAIGDVNNDGLTDIVVTDQTNVVSIYLNRFDRGNPSRFDPDNPNNDLANLFSKPILLQAGPGAIDVLILDLNKDGKQDLVVSSSGSNTLNVFFGR
jgi:hypothetical protein